MASNVVFAGRLLGAFPRREIQRRPFLAPPEIRPGPLVHVGAVVEQPLRDVQHPSLRRHVQHRHAVRARQASQLRVSFEDGDDLVFAAAPHGTLELSIGVGHCALAAGAAPGLFFRDEREDVVVSALAGHGARTRGVAIRPDAVAGVRSRVEQHPRHLDVSLHDGDVKRTDFVA